MKQVLRSTAVLGASSLVTIAAGILREKVKAVELEPSGVGYFALLQSVMVLASLALGFGLGPALVRSGAVAIGQSAQERLSGLWTAAWALMGVVTIPAAIGMWFFRSAIGEVFVGSRSASAAVGWIIVAVAFSLASGLDRSLINAMHRVDLLAKLDVWTALLQTALTVSIILIYGLAGVPAAIVASAVSAWITSRWAVTKRLDRVPTLSLPAARPFFRELSAFGGPYMLAMLAGTGAQRMLLVVVLAVFDQAHVGIVQASTALSITYIGFLLSAMSMDYFPRLSAVAHDNSRANEVMNGQLELIFLISVPFVFAAMAVAPLAVRLLYTEAFAEASAVLEWQLVGDVWKFAGWALAFVMLASGTTRLFLATEMFAGAVMLSATYVGLLWLGLPGFGVGYLVTTFSYCWVVYAVARRSVGFRFTPDNFRRFLWFGTGTLAVKIALDVVEGPWVYVLPGLVAVITAVGALRRGRVIWNRETS